MAYKVIILYQLYMPSYFLGTFTEYPELVTKYIYHYFCCWRTAREKALRRMMAYAVQTEMPVITQEIG